MLGCNQNRYRGGIVLLKTRDFITLPGFPLTSYFGYGTGHEGFNPTILYSKKVLPYLFFNELLPGHSCHIVELM